MSRFDDLVADQASFGASQSSRLSYMIACRAMRSPGESAAAACSRLPNDAFLASGQAEKSTFRCQDIVHRQQVLAVSADGELLDYGHPGISMVLSFTSSGVISSCATRGRICFDDAKVALQVQMNGTFRSRGE